MKTIITGVLSLLLSQTAFASGPDWMLGSSLNNAVTYVQAGADVVTAAGSSVSILSRTTHTPQTFYLDTIDMEAALNTVSATAVRLGTCSLQIPSGTTVMSWNFQNPTNEAPDRHFVKLTHAIAVPSSFTISCYPNTNSASTYWNVNYFGYEN